MKSLYEQIIKDNFGSGFVLDVMDGTIKELLPQYGCKHVLFPVNKAAFRYNRQAYEDRARRIVRLAEACYCIVDSEDRSYGPIGVAKEFTKQHPNSLLVIYFVNGDSWSEMEVTKDDGEIDWKSTLRSK
jgi:hypothetical protein